MPPGEERYNEGDYRCDDCGTLGNFTDGTMYGIGEGNLEKCVCNDCLNNLHSKGENNG